MIEPIKRQALGLAALQVLTFTAEYAGKCSDAFEQLKNDVRNGREPEHCSIRDGFNFWSWFEVIAHIEQSAEILWQPIEVELQSAKERMLVAVEGQVLNVEVVQELDIKTKHSVLIQALINAVNEVNKETESVSDMYSIRQYSGRCMYGRYCLGLYIPPTRGDAIPVALKMRDGFKLLGQGSYDSMGLGFILYWPSIAYL